MAAAQWERVGGNAYDERFPIYRWHILDGTPSVPLVLAPKDDRTVQMFVGGGTGFNGQTITVQGTNEIASPANWATLNDSRGVGNPATLSAAGIVTLMEVTYQVRIFPNGAVGDVWVYLSAAE